VRPFPPSPGAMRSVRNLASCAPPDRSAGRVNSADGSTGTPRRFKILVAGFGRRILENAAYGAHRMMPQIDAAPLVAWLVAEQFRIADVEDREMVRGPEGVVAAR